MKKLSVFIITIALVGSIFTGVAKAQEVPKIGFNIQSADHTLVQQYISLLMQLVKILQAQLAQLQAEQAQTRAIVDTLATSTQSVPSTMPALAPIQAPAIVSGGSSPSTPEVVAPAPITQNMDNYYPQVVLTASSTSGKVGDKVLLSWNVSAQGATRFECSASGDWYGDVEASGSREVELTKQGVMSFTLNCKALPGNYAGSAKVEVSVQ